MTETKPVANMELWDSVQKTDPKYTKEVELRGGFTSICAQSQIMQATKKWGPMGSQWSIESEIIQDKPNVILKVTLSYPRHRDESIDNIKQGYTDLSYGKVHQYGSAKNVENKDDDSYKKALTDGTTKCLSLLGFNADIFLGMWEDNKYVNQLKDDKTGNIAPGQDLDKAKKAAYRTSKKLPDKRRVLCEEIFQKMPQTVDNILCMDKLAEAFSLINKLPADRQGKCEEYVTWLDTTKNDFYEEVGKALSMIKARIKDYENAS